MDFGDIVGTYFIYPLANRTGEYNVINTVTYATLLFIGTYIVYVKLLKNKVDMDAKFALSFSSFAVFAASMHVLDDMKIIVSSFLVTPLIQGIMYVLFLVLLPFSLFVQKHWKIKYWKILTAITLAPSSLIILFILSRAQNVQGLAYIVLGFAISTSVVYSVRKMLPKILTNENISVLAAHMLDASSTFVSIAFFGYREQHFLPTFLMGMFGPIVMYPLKLLVIGFVLYSFDNEIRDKNLRTFFKILVLVLGLAPGLRDTLRLSVLA